MNFFCFEKKVENTKKNQYFLGENGRKLLKIQKTLVKNIIWSFGPPFNPSPDGVFWPFFLMAKKV